MILKCYVIDDEQHAIEVISRHIRNTPGLDLVGAELNPLNAIRTIGDGELSPDITFVDIDMPQMTGIDFAELVGNRTLVIFTTAFPNYAVSAFDKNALDYMLKPITYERFLKAVDKARQKISEKKARSVSDEKSNYFFIKIDVKGKLVKISEDDIVYIEAKQNYIQINLENNHYLTYLSLAEIEEKLPQDKFVRCHKSFIASLQKVKVVEGGVITFIDGRQILLGSTYKVKLMESIAQKLFKSKRNQP